MYQITRLTNGLTVATAEMPHMASVSVGVWVGVGSRYEPAALNGVCHFIEHLLFKGTRKRSAKQISEAIEGLGGSLNAFTSEETTCFHARACHDRFDDLLEVLMDMFLESRFAPADIVRERAVILEEIAMCQDEPQHHVQELLNATLWPGQALGRPITGTEKTLRRHTRARLIRFWQTNYVAGSVFIVAAGNVKHRKAVRAAAAYTRRLSAAQRPPFLSARHNQQTPRLRLFTKATEQTQLALAFRACSRHDRRRYALRLLNAILGENMSSRLFQVLREDRGLVYSIYSAPSFFADTGDLAISAGVDTGNLPKALRLILRELRRLARTPPSSTEVGRARDFVVGQMELSLESTDNQMNWLGEQLLGYGRVTPPEDIKRCLHQVTAGEIRAAADDFFRPERLNLALVSRLKSGKSLAKSLRF